MVVNGVDLAKLRAHFADFQKKPGGKRGEGDVGLFDVYASFAKGNESVGARVGIDDGLQADFGFVQFERGRRRNVVASCGADEVADQADIGIEELGVGGGASKNLSLSGLRWGRLRRSGDGGGRGGSQNARCEVYSRKQNGFFGARFNGSRVAHRFHLASEQGYLLGQRAHLILESLHARFFRRCDWRLGGGHVFLRLGRGSLLCRGNSRKKITADSTAI